MHHAAPIHAYGLDLRPMTAADIEQVRQWRNADHVRSRMAHTELISEQEQQLWWQGLEVGANHYYLIEQGGAGCGVIHAKDIDWQAGTAEAGIFMGDMGAMGTMVPVCAVLALMDDLFGRCGLGKLRCKVKASALQTLDFNRRLGYVEVGLLDGFVLMEVGKSQYQATADKLKAMAIRWAQSAARN